jgi:hypothetical protein
MKARKLNTDKVSVSLSKEINKKLSDYCQDKLINKSKLINRLIDEFLRSSALSEKK